ncbi:alpha/beta fold hydrolase [Candidatus Dojkabacteria bacterium]|uniref:Alpha/beta fold hydrolase n=1 Tax=Candidatus Dojkabacteria bacterium TaxID=2099670 RepID=A0A955I5X2_9BACT|nr:alpha/beta fold hydrolase [Candidatus Dojkabacteria bacterium]
MDTLKFKYQDAELEYTKLRPRLPNNLLRSLTGRPTQVLFLHGFNEPFSKHESLLRGISSQGFEVFAINMPGHGASGKLELITWDILVDIVVQFAQNQKLSKPILFGYSMGGGIALKVLESKKIEIDSLRLISPFCYSQTVESLRTAAGFLQEAVNVVENAQKTSKPIPLVNPASTAYTVSAYLNIFLNFVIDISHNKKSILVILPELDPVIRIDSAEQVLRAIPNLTIYTLPDASHDIYYLSQEQENAIISKLFN